MASTVLMLPPLLLALALLTPAAVAQTITNVRLVSGTNPGIVEVQLSDGTWGRLCNARSVTDPGFDNNAASVVCAMLGFRPITGYAISVTVTTGVPRAVAALTNCPTFSASDSNTWTLTQCQYVTSSIPAACSARTLDAGVSCAGALTTSTATPFTGTTPTPNMATLSPGSCTNNSNLQLLPGPNQGLVLIRETVSKDFGTVCAVGFGSNEARAICSMLCQGTLSPVSFTGKYLNESAGYSVALSGLNCPVGANSTNDCRHNGWGVASSPCSSKLAISVRCTEVAATAVPPPVATVECKDNRAYVYFSISRVTSASLLTLYGSYDNATCAFSTTENATTVWAEIPYAGCNTVVTTNSTHTLYTAYLFRSVRPINGVYFDTAYIYPIVCAIGKLGAATAQMQPDAPTVPPVSGGDSHPSDLALFGAYSTAGFSRPIAVGQTLTIGSQAYLRVQTLSALDVKLVVRSCYATPTTSGSTTPYFLVRDKCNTDANELFRISNKVIGIKFTVMSFTSSPLSTTRAYFFCDVTVCASADTSERCVQACGTATRRRRRSVEDAEMDTSSHRGPYELADAIFASAAIRDSRASCLMVTMATAMLTALAFV